MIWNWIKRRYTEYMNPNDAVRFQVLRPKIEVAINEALKKPSAPKDPQGFTLLESFIVTPLQSSVGATFNIGGDSAFIQVAIVGKSTGVVHYFAVKALLKPEDIRGL